MKYTVQKTTGDTGNTGRLEESLTCPIVPSDPSVPRGFSLIC